MPRAVVMAKEELPVHASLGDRECLGFSLQLHCSPRIHHTDPPLIFISHSPSVAATALLRETHPRSSAMYQSVFPALCILDNDRLAHGDTSQFPPPHPPNREGMAGARGQSRRLLAAVRGLLSLSVHQSPEELKRKMASPPLHPLPRDSDSISLASVILCVAKGGERTASEP